MEAACAASSRRLRLDNLRLFVPPPPPLPPGPPLRRDLEEEAYESWSDETEASSSWKDTTSSNSGAAASSGKA